MEGLKDGWNQREEDPFDILTPSLIYCSSTTKSLLLSKFKILPHLVILFIFYLFFIYYCYFFFNLFF